jgi:predicted SnoaL-like aldol condensation-catalyzing enzyme
VIGLGVISDIVRMIGTCLVEHWNVAQGADPSNSSNPDPFF